MAFINTTWATLRTHLSTRLDGSQHWTNAELLITFNDVLHFWNLLTGQWRRTVTLTFTAPQGDAYLVVPGTVIWPMRMELADGTPVERASISSLNLVVPGWPGHTTADGGSVPSLVTYWAPRSLQLLTLYPRPTITTSVTLDGVAETPVLAADGDFLDLDEGLHEDLLDLAAHWSQFKDGGPVFAAGLPALDKLILRAGDINAELLTLDIYRSAQARDRDRDLTPRVQPIDRDAGRPARSLGDRRRTSASRGAR